MTNLTICRGDGLNLKKKFFLDNPTMQIADQLQYLYGAEAVAQPEGAGLQPFHWLTEQNAE